MGFMLPASIFFGKSRKLNARPSSTMGFNIFALLSALKVGMLIGVKQI